MSDKKYETNGRDINIYDDEHPFVATCSSRQRAKELVTAANFHERLEDFAKIVAGLNESMWPERLVTNARQLLAEIAEAQK